MRRALLLLAVGVAAALPGARAARAAPDPLPLGPQLGNVSWRGDLVYGPDGADVDDFAGRLAAGERLSVRVRVPSRSGLYPELTLVAPDGTVLRPDVRARSSGRDLELRDWVVPETGVWRLRIGALFESWGAYQFRASLRRADPVVRVVEADESGGEAASVDVPIDALEGSRLDVTVKARGRTVPVIASLRDPAGAPVVDEAGLPATESVRKKRSVLSLPGVVLGAGDGEYVLRVTAPAGHDGFEVRASVVGPPRARGSRKLAKTEPWIEPIVFPLRGVKERLVRVRGRSLAPGAVVLFGDVPGTEVSVESFGTYLDVRPPELPGKSLVRIAVVNPDGQADEQADAFYYVPEPRVDDFVDLAGAPVRGASTAGGRVLRVVGANFESGIFVQFGASADVLPQIRSSTEMELVTPAGAAGLVEVRFLDAYSHDVRPPFLFEMKVPPQFALSAPYDPAEPAGDGTAQVTVSGAFEFEDVVLFDGEPAATTWLAPWAVRFTVPATEPGSYRVAVRDRVGTVVRGPDLVVSEP